MQDVVCAVCGRRTALAPGAALACPSCGAPISAPVTAAEAEAEATLASSPADSFDDSATRPSIPPISADSLVPPASPVPPVALAAQPFADDPASATAPVGAALPVAAGDVDEARTMRVVNDDDINVTRESDVTADFPMQAALARTQTVPAVDTSFSEPSAPSDPSKPPRKRGPFALVSVVLLILLLIAIGAAGVLLANGKLPLFSATPTATIAATATPAPTATPQTALTLFTDADNVFHIGYPTGWLKTIQNQSGVNPRLAIFSNPPMQANFNIGTLPTTDVPAQGVVEQTLAVLAQKTGIAHRSGPTTVFIAGQTWTQEAGDVTVIQNGTPTPMHAVALATIHGGHTIYILELAPVDTFATVDPFFQQMLQSFEFLS